MMSTVSCHSSLTGYVCSVPFPGKHSFVDVTVATQCHGCWGHIDVAMATQCHGHWRSIVNSINKLIRACIQLPASLPSLQESSEVECCLCHKIDCAECAPNVVLLGKALCSHVHSLDPGVSGYLVGQWRLVCLNSSMHQKWQPGCMLPGELRWLLNKQVLWPRGNCVKSGEWRFAIDTRL